MKLVQYYYMRPLPCAVQALQGSARAGREKVEEAVAAGRRAVGLGPGHEEAEEEVGAGAALLLLRSAGWLG